MSGSLKPFYFFVVLCAYSVYKVFGEPWAKWSPWWEAYSYFLLPLRCQSEGSIRRTLLAWFHIWKVRYLTFLCCQKYICLKQETGKCSRFYSTAYFCMYLLRLFSKFRMYGGHLTMCQGICVCNVNMCI